MKHAWISTLALAAAITAGAGCVKNSVYTTSRLEVPVIIGPVKTLQASAPSDPGKVMAAVIAEINNYYFVSSSQHQDGAGNTVQTTTVGWKRQGSSHFDKAFGEALMTCATCIPKTNRIDVGAYSMYLIFSVMEKNWAGLDGSINGW